MNDRRLAATQRTSIDEVRLLEDAISSAGQRLTGKQLAARGGKYRLVNRKDLMLRILKTLEVFVEDRVRQAEAQMRDFIEEREEKAAEDGRMRVLVSLADLADLVDTLITSLGESESSAGALALDKRMDRVFKSYGLMRTVTTGAPFDPALHEMLDGRPDSGETPGIILEEVGRGYHRDDFVLRVARVIVAE